MPADDEKFIRETFGAAIYEAMRRKESEKPPAAAAPPPEAPAHSLSDAPPPARPEPELRAADFIGQSAAQQGLERVISLARVNAERQSRGLATVHVTLHAVFAGSPGTGKTTFARYYAQQIRGLGILAK